MLSCVVLAAVGTVPAVGQAPRSAFLSDLEVMPQLFFGCPLQKIISGGQTGVDRAALAVAVFLEVPHGGWCPRGRRAEDGTIPGIYQLKETDSPHYAVRTQQNITDSDGTLVLIGGDISGGTALTITLARRYRRPLLVVNLEEEHDYV